MSDTDDDQVMTSRTIDPPVLYAGTPVILVSSLNPDGTPNLAPMSSGWVLGDTAILGLGTSGQTFQNLSRRADCVINYASDSIWRNVERLAPLTGANPVPATKANRSRYEKHKFAAAGLTPLPADKVAAPRVAECPIQAEGEVVDSREGAEDGVGIVEVRLLRVHVHESLAAADGRHINVAEWRPLFYVFRHYIGRGLDLGRTFRAAD